MDEISAPMQRSAAAARNREQFMARRALLQARQIAKREAAKARRALLIARMKINQANEATQTAAVSGDEFGRAKKGAARRAERQEAKQQRQQARQAQKAAKKQIQTARRAAAQAKRTAKAVQRQQAKQTRKVAKQTRKVAVRTQRAAARAVPMPRRTRTRALPEAPMEEPMEAPMEEPMEEIMEEPMDEAQEPEYEEVEVEEVEPDYEAEEMGHNYLGLDEIGARGGKQKRQAKRAARKTKRTARKTKRGGSVVKKIAAAPMRAAFLLLMKTNALKIRTKLRAAWMKDKNAVNTRIIKKFGFKPSVFMTELNRKESQKLSGYFGEPVSISAAIISATPVITAALALFKNLNVPAQDLEKEVSTAREKDQSSGGGFKITTGLVVTAAAVAALALWPKK